MTIIEADHLTKVFHVPQKDPGIAGAVKALFRPRYQDKTAVDAISFKIDEGEIFGFIGVNGAGKSTTIKMLTGILAPTSGQARVLGRNPHSDRVANAREIGVVFGQRTQMWWDLALIESLTMIGKIYEVPKARFSALMDQFAETLELKELLRVPIRNMSLGQKMRAELAATLIHEPRIVYLDEPTIGLDVLVKERIRTFIKEQNKERATTVMLTTHDLGDIEELCQRVIIIDAGKLIYDGPLHLIKDRFGKYRTLTVETFQPVDGAIGKVSLPTGAEIENAEGMKVMVRFDRTVTTASQVAGALMGQIEVKDFALQEPDLVTIVKQIYNGALKNALPEVNAEAEGITA